MNSSGLDAPIFVPANEPDRRRDGFCVDQRQLSVVPHVKAEIMDGHSSCKTQEPVERIMPLNESEGVIHKATPLSYKLPDSKVIVRTMKTGKRWLAPRPYLPSDERRISVGEKLARLEKTDWLQDWIIELSQRANGKYEFFFHHKTKKLKLRSLNTTYNYQMYGILPTRNKKPKTDKSLVQSTEENVKPAETGITKSKKRNFEKGSSTSAPIPTENTYRVEESVSPISVEEFMRDSHNNLLKAVFPAQDHEEDDHEILREINVEEFMRESYENLINRGSKTSAPKPKASKGGKKKRSTEETSAKGEGEKFKVTNNNKPVRHELFPAKVQDGLLYDVQVKFDIELPEVHV